MNMRNLLMNRENLSHPFPSFICRAYLAVLCRDVEVVLGHEAEYFSDEEPGKMY